LFTYNTETVRKKREINPGMGRTVMIDFDEKSGTWDSSQLQQ
jgi:hypothetical protein